MENQGNQLNVEPPHREGLPRAAGVIYEITPGALKRFLQEAARNPYTGQSTLTPYEVLYQLKCWGLVIQHGFDSQKMDAAGDLATFTGQATATPAQLVFELGLKGITMRPIAS